MKFIPQLIILLMAALAAGCASSGDQSESERFLGKREQHALLAKTKSLSEFGFSNADHYGNGLLYYGAMVLEPNQTSSMTFEPGGLPVIELQGKSSRTKMTVLLDTSSNASWMQYSCAAKNDLVFLDVNGQAIPYRGMTSTGGANAYAGVLPFLQIGQLNLKNTPCYIRMAKGKMQPVIHSSMAPRVDAVLGYDNLRQFQYIQFNIREGTVRFSTSTPYTPDENRLIGSAPISAVCKDSLAVDGAIFSDAAPIILDFAGDYSFASGNIQEPVTKQVQLGEIIYINVPTERLSAQDRYPRAGLRMLEKYIVTIRPRQGVVHFERP